MTARSGWTAARGLRQAAILLCALLAASGALELHNLANHHQSFPVGAIVDQAASHPRTEHHFEPSEELREPGCATCALQAQARGVHPEAAGEIGPAGDIAFAPASPATPALSSLPSSASPRGPPAA